MDPHSYSIHGDLVRSSIALSANSASGEVPDVVIDRPYLRAVAASPPRGRALLTAELPWRFSVVHRGGDAYSVHYSGHVRFDVEVGVPSRITVHGSTSSDLDAAPLLLQGAVLAVLAALRGRLAIHASAVTVGDHGVLFVGRTNSGKSTVAALSCAAGARLLSDDVVVVDLTERHTAHVHPGLIELRLRAAAEAIAQLVSPTHTRRAVDGRLAVTTASAPCRHVPVRLVCLIQPDRSAARVAIDAISPDMGFDLLRRNLRHVGWNDGAIVAREFDQLIRLAATVPTVVLRVPWLEWRTASAGDGAVALGLEVNEAVASAFRTGL